METLKKTDYLLDLEDEKYLSQIFLNGKNLSPFRKEAVNRTLNECAFYIFIDKHAKRFLSLQVKNADNIWKEINGLYLAEVNFLILYREELIAEINKLDLRLKMVTQPRSKQEFTEKEVKHMARFRDYLTEQLGKRPPTFESSLEKYNSCIILLKVLYKKGIHGPRKNPQLKDLSIKVKTTNSLSCEKAKVDRSAIFENWPSNYKKLHGESTNDSLEGEKKSLKMLKLSNSLQKLLGNSNGTSTEKLLKHVSGFFNEREEHSKKIPKNGFFFSNMKLECSQNLVPNCGLLPQNLGLGMTIFKLPQSFSIDQKKMSTYLSGIANKCEKVIKNHDKTINPHLSFDVTDEDQSSIKIDYLGSDKNALIFLGKNKVLNTKTKNHDYYLIVRSLCEKSALKLWETIIREKKTVLDIMNTTEYPLLLQNSYRKRCALAYRFISDVLGIDEIEVAENPKLNLDHLGKLSGVTLETPKNVKYAKDSGNCIFSYIKEGDKKNGTGKSSTFYIHSNETGINNADGCYFYQHTNGNVDFLKNFIFPLDESTNKQTKLDSEISFQYKKPTYSFKNFTTPHHPSQLELEIANKSREFVLDKHISKTPKRNEMEKSSVKFLEHTHSPIYFSTTALEQCHKLRSSVLNDYEPENLFLAKALSIYGNEFSRGGVMEGGEDEDDGDVQIYNKGRENHKKDHSLIRITLQPIYIRFSTEDPGDIPLDHFVSYVDKSSNRFFYLPWKHPLDRYLQDEAIIIQYDKSSQGGSSKKTTDKKGGVSQEDRDLLEFLDDKKTSFYPMEFDPSLPFLRKFPVELLEFIQNLSKK